MTNFVPPDSYLIRTFIGFAEENELSLKRAAIILRDYAAQEQPLLKLERTKTAAEEAHHKKIVESKKIPVVVRLHATTRIYFLSWIIYPEHSMASAYPNVFYWIRRKEISNDIITKAENRWGDFIFLDNLYYAEDYELIWTSEQQDIQETAANVMKKTLLDASQPTLAKSRSLVKISPQVVSTVLRTRKGIPSIIRRELSKIDHDKFWTDNHAIGRPKNWKSLLKCIPYTYRRGKTGIKI